MYQRILVPLDGSATSKEGLDEAIRLAARTHGRLQRERFVAGSCAEYLLRCTPVPVLLVRAPSHGDAQAHHHAH